MINAKTYKSKLILLIIGIIFSLLIVYNLAFKKSITAVQLYSKSKAELENIENVPVQLAKLNAELEKISGVIVSGSNTTDEIRQQLFDVTSDYCQLHKTKLVEMPNPIVYDKSGYRILTHTLVMSGSFNKLLNYIYHLEQESKLIKITSTEFYIEKIRNRSRSKKLYLKVYFQNLEKIV